MYHDIKTCHERDRFIALNLLHPPSNPAILYNNTVREHPIICF
jgi:hypothetical protein